MHEYYLKKLGRQEMGSPSVGPDGNTLYARGRYIYISKEHDGFFPHLSETVLNDKAIIKLSMPFSNNLIFATFGYHNSGRIDTVFTDGQGRNELRLYLNNQLDQDKRYFHPDEIVVFHKIQFDESDIYVVYIFQPSDPSYNELSALIDRRKGFALIDYPLECISGTRIIGQPNAEMTDSVLDVVEESQQEIIDSGDEYTAEELALGAGIFNSNTFSDIVMQVYNYKCAVTQRVIRCHNLSNLEAAHIKPRAHHGLYLPCNGIAMCRDMHFAFDKGFFTIDDQYKIVVHPDVLATESYLNEYNGREIALPLVDAFRPKHTYLQYHQDNIYGTFRQIRSIDG